MMAASVRGGRHGCVAGAHGPGGKAVCTSPMDRAVWDGRLRRRGRPPDHVRGLTVGSSVPPGTGRMDRPRETPKAHA